LQHLTLTAAEDYDGEAALKRSVFAPELSRYTPVTSRPLRREVMFPCDRRHLPMRAGCCAQQNAACTRIWHAACLRRTRGKN